MRVPSAWPRSRPRSRSSSLSSAAMKTVVARAVEARSRPSTSFAGQAARADGASAVARQLALLLQVLVLARELARVGLLDDAPEVAGRRAARGGIDDGAERRAALGLDQHAVVAMEDQRARVEVVDVARGAEADADDQRMRGGGVRRWHGVSARAAPRSTRRSASSIVSSASTRLAFRFDRADRITDRFECTQDVGGAVTRPRGAAAAPQASTFRTRRPARRRARRRARRGTTTPRRVERRRRRRRAPSAWATAESSRRGRAAEAGRAWSSMRPRAPRCGSSASATRASGRPVGARHDGRADVGRDAAIGEQPVDERRRAAGRARTRWQRERTVGSRSDASVARAASSTAAPGGSSSVFRSAFCPCSFRHSARRRRSATFRAAISGRSVEPARHLARLLGADVAPVLLARDDVARPDACRRRRRVHCAHAPHASPSRGASQTRLAVSARGERRACRRRPVRRQDRRRAGLARDGGRASWRTARSCPTTSASLMRAASSRAQRRRRRCARSTTAASAVESIDDDARRRSARRARGTRRGSARGTRSPRARSDRRLRGARLRAREPDVDRDSRAGTSATGASAVARVARRARGRRRGRARGRSPDTRSSSRRSGRRRRSGRAARAGRITSAHVLGAVGAVRGTARPSGVSGVASAPSSSARIACAGGVPPGSRVSDDDAPARAQARPRASARATTCRSPRCPRT